MAQWEERSLGTAEVPGSAPGGGSWTDVSSVGIAPVARLDAQRPPKPEDARSNRAGGAVGRGSPTRCIWRVDREERCSLAKRRPRATSPAFDPLSLRPGRYASLAGAPCFENRYTALPWGFDTSTFRSSSRPVRPAVGRLPLTQRTQVRVLHGSPSAGDAHPGPSCGRKACGGQHKRKAGMHSPRGMT